MAREFDGAFWPLINKRVRDHSGQPFLTSIDAQGFRTELSGVTLLNAVAKNAGALVDEGDLEPGSTIAIYLPWHWQRVTWTLAAWTIGAVVLAEADAASADLVLTDLASVDSLKDADEPWVVSMHPLGLVEAGLPTNVVDATGLSRMQPDALLVPPADGDDRAIFMGDQSLSRVAALDWVASKLPDTSARVLINQPDSTDFTGWLIPALFPLLGSGSVIMTNTADISSISQQEGATQIL
jgi:uncharacterized protein (TIGR03089 family)